MIENLMKSAVCQVKCGNDNGTGWVVSADQVITARHCVTSAIASNEVVELIFLEPEGPRTVIARVAAHDDELDVAILVPSEKFSEATLPAFSSVPREGAHWVSYGFPNGKSHLGHRLDGRIAQVLAVPRMRVDVDLLVSPDCALSAYAGLSGSPLLVDGKCVGIIRLKVDRTLAAVSIRSMSQFLSQHGVAVVEEKSSTASASQELFAKRTSFQTEFETALKATTGAYMFLEGAHGIGKTTFCAQFVPIDQSLLILGTYSLASMGRGAGPVVRAQPNVFYDWLLTAISNQISGKAERKADLSYPDMVDQAAQLLEAFGEYCAARSVQGVFFIDGINEGQAGDASAMTKLIGLLPSKLPSTVSVVLTAPNHQAVSGTVTSLVSSKNVQVLPRLSDNACADYCRNELQRDRHNVSLVEEICKKSQGHPLYLRYLIEYINEEHTTTLQDFPTLSGSIEQYYETIWAGLLTDTDAVHLLGIMARLRWGIPAKTVLHMLSQPEQAAFVPTMSRIRHLLRGPDTTEIYHSSFTEFLLEKTSEIERIVQRRIATFCLASPTTDYCLLNVVYHMLNGDDDSRREAISTCQQQWIDNCVLLGVEPDVALGDIENALSAAIHLAEGNEAIRLLLLQQRVSFRYDVLFAQSAYLIANALIAVGRPDEALKIAIRFNTLVIDPDDALKIAYSFILRGHAEQAFTILRKLQRHLSEIYGPSTSATLFEFLETRRQLIQIQLYANLNDGHSRGAAVGRILRSGIATLS